MQIQSGIELATRGDDSAHELSFGERFRRLRQQHAGKQATLVAAGLSCTDAAISQWETGRRLPSSKMLFSAIHVFASLGVSEKDIVHLRSIWEQERTRRRSAGSASLARQSSNLPKALWRTAG